MISVLKKKNGADHCSINENVEHRVDSGASNGEEAAKVIASSPNNVCSSPAARRIVIGAGQPIPSYLLEMARNDRKGRAKSNNQPTKPLPGISVLDANLQRRFASGVDFNMKIVIRGDRNSGKTALWKRLQGDEFFDDCYICSPEIQVASVAWRYRTRDHVVKVDVWDVVDEGVRQRPIQNSSSTSGGLTVKGFWKRKQTHSTLKLVNNSDAPSVGAHDGNASELTHSAACDATTVDVYKQCNAVIIIFDVTRPWTWTYVQRELPKVPAHLPILVLANKVDLLVDTSVPATTTSSATNLQQQAASNNTSPTKTVAAPATHQPVVSIDDCLAYFSFVDRLPSKGAVSINPPGNVYFARTSMKFARGLRFIYNFFNIPFLLMQRDCLERSLVTNIEDLSLAEAELVAAEEEEFGTAVARATCHSAAIPFLRVPTDGVETEDESPSISASSSQAHLLLPKHELFAASGRGNNLNNSVGGSCSLYGTTSTFLTTTEKRFDELSSSEVVVASGADLTAALPIDDVQIELPFSSSPSFIAAAPADDEQKAKNLSAAFSIRMQISALVETTTAADSTGMCNRRSSGDVDDMDREEGGWCGRPLVDMYEEDYIDEDVDIEADTIFMMHDKNRVKNADDSNTFGKMLEQTDRQKQPFVQQRPAVLVNLTESDVKTNNIGAVKQNDTTEEDVRLRLDPIKNGEEFLSDCSPTLTTNDALMIGDECRPRLISPNNVTNESVEPLDRKSFISQTTNAIEFEDGSDEETVDASIKLNAGGLRGEERRRSPNPLVARFSSFDDDDSESSSASSANVDREWPQQSQFTVTTLRKPSSSSKSTKKMESGGKNNAPAIVQQQSSSGLRQIDAAVAAAENHGFDGGGKPRFRCNDKKKNAPKRTKTKSGAVGQLCPTRPPPSSSVLLCEEGGGIGSNNGSTRVDERVCYNDGSHRSSWTADGALIDEYEPI